jgi:hypothetical protein
MRENVVLRAGPCCGLAVIEIQDKDGNAIRWDVIGAGGITIMSCLSLDAAIQLFEDLVVEVNNGLRRNGGGAAQEQEDPVEPTDSEEPDVPR